MALLSFKSKYLVSLILLFIPGLALAHGGDHGIGSLGAGFLHPFTGLDHLFTLIALGLVWSRAEPTRHVLAAVLLALVVVHTGMHLIGIPSAQLYLYALGMVVASAAITLSSGFTARICTPDLQRTLGRLGAAAAVAASSVHLFS